MIIKTAIATFITASLAGGVVYYGTQGETGENRGYGNEVSINLHPEEPDDSVRNPIVDAAEKPKTKHVVRENSSERVIDRLLKRNAEQNAAAPQPDNTESEERDSADNSDASEPKSNTVDNSSDYIPYENTPTDPEYIGASESTPYLPPVDETQQTNLDAHDSNVDEPVDSGTKTMLDVIFAQTEEIKTTELKDQAYLDIVSYASAQGMYPSADKAMKSIDQVELRDTARSQIAISLAKRGFVDGAFDIIDNVETDELRDIMRLQVIEAIILPERLPKVYQQY